MSNAKDLIVSAIVSALTALVVVGLVLWMGHGNVKAGQTASTLGTNVIPTVLPNGSAPSVVNAFEASESFISDGPMYASSTLLLTGNATLFGQLVLGGAAGSQTIVSDGSCATGTTTPMSILNPFGATSTARITRVSGTNATSTLSFFVSTSTGASASLNANTVGTLINATVATSAQFTLNPFSEAGYTVNASATGVFRAMEVGPTQYLILQATSSANDTYSATRIMALTGSGTTAGLSCAYKVTWEK